MNKKNNRKGFTIVELVIVIAVIAILATVLVPTFSNMIEKANNSKTLQALKNEYTEYTLSVDVTEDDIASDIVIKYNGTYYQIDNGAPKLENDEYVTVTETEAAVTGYWDAAAEPANAWVAGTPANNNSTPDVSTAA